MYVDSQATKRAPVGWTIWRTPTQWQAMQGDLRWGPMRENPEHAIDDAVRIDSSPCAKGEG